MATPLSKQRLPHAADCTLGKPVEWFKGRTANKDTSVPLDPGLRSYCSCGNNPLDAEDFTRLRLPRRFWGATLEGVSPSARTQVGNYARKIHEAKSRAISLYICGSSGVGKTGAAVVLLKEARSWGYTAYFTAVNDLREAIRAETHFDAEGPVISWCRNVDFLVLDGLQETDTTEKYGALTINDIRNLMVSRADRGLVTITTSSITLKSWETLHRPMLNALEKTSVMLQITGPNRHEKTQKDNSDILK